MSLTTSEMTPADIAACTGNRNNDGGIFGGDGLISLIVLFLFASMFGFGGFGGGLGGFGGGGILPWLLLGNGGFGFGGGCGCGAPATQADLAAGFNNSAVLNSLNDIKMGQAQAINYNNQGFNGLNTALLQGFNGVERGFCDISHQLSECCCGTQRAIDGVKYQMATDTCAVQNTINGSARDIVDNQNANARAILEALTAQRLADKDERIAEQNQKIFALELAASQANQNAALMAAMDANKAEILRRSGHDCPTAAYLVQPPTAVNFPTNGCGTVQFGCNPCGAGC
jgi:hypothetical protein